MRIQIRFNGSQNPENQQVILSTETDDGRFKQELFFRRPQARVETEGCHAGDVEFNLVLEDCRTTPL